MVVDAFLVYSFIKRLVTPFEKWKAYSTGVIDKDGRVLVPPRSRTREQSASFTYYDTMLLNLKKTLSIIPGGGTRLATYAAALWLIKEPKPVNESVDSSDFDLTQKSEFIRFIEEVTTSTSGVAGVDLPINFKRKRHDNSTDESGIFRRNDSNQ